MADTDHIVLAAGLLAAAAAAPTPATAAAVLVTVNTDLAVVLQDRVSKYLKDNGIDIVPAADADSVPIPNYDQLGLRNADGTVSFTQIYSTDEHSQDISSCADHVAISNMLDTFAGSLVSKIVEQLSEGARCNTFRVLVRPTVWTTFADSGGVQRFVARAWLVGDSGELV